MSMSAEDKRVWLLIAFMVALALLCLPLSGALFDIRYTYTVRVVALGGALLGLVSGALGCFAVLRRESLMGDALSHAALPGVALAFLIAGKHLAALLIGAGIASWLASRFVAALISTTRLKQDAALGIALTGFFAAGIAALAYIQSIPDASQAGLDYFIFGQAAAIVESDVRLISAVGGVSLLALVMFWKEFKLLTFDPAFAGATGFRVGLMNTLLSTLIVIAIVLGLQLAGVILMVGMLIAPGIAARQWTRQLHQMVILAGVFGAFAGGMGAIMSAVDSDIPTGPMIIVAASALVLLSICLAPGRGLVWRAWRQRVYNRQFARQHALRDLYRYAIAHGGEGAPVPDSFARGLRGSADLGLRQLKAAGHASLADESWSLTPAGIAAAKTALVRDEWECDS